MVGGSKAEGHGGREGGGWKRAKEGIFRQSR